MFHRLCQVTNVPQLRVHDLRHSCATLLFTMGVPPATVQRILRHSSITVTIGTHQPRLRGRTCPLMRCCTRFDPFSVVGQGGNADAEVVIDELAHRFVQDAGEVAIEDLEIAADDFGR